MVSKKAFLRALKHTVYCRIAVSDIHGIGVKAIRNIPAGIDPFISFVQNKKYIFLQDEDLKSLPKNIRCYIKDYYIKTENGYPVLLQGLNDVSIFGYMNHSATPNIGLYPDKQDELCKFVSLKNIKKGEELLWDYRHSGVENLTQQFPFI